MTFSIIIPIFKTEKYLDECVQSVLSQSFIDYECILIDDGSPDNCPSMCDGYSRNDTRIKVIHKENGGLSNARNVGILQAKGKYIVFLDSDDRFFDNNTLKNLFDVVQKYVADIILNVNIIEFTDNGKTSVINRYSKDITFDSPSVILEAFHKADMYLAGCFFVLKKDYLIKNDLFFKESIFHEDEHWIPRILYKTQKIAVNHYPFYAYRIERDGSIISNITVKKIFDLLDIINDLLIWAKEEDNYTKEGCAYMLERARFLYYHVYNISDAIRFQDKKAFYNIHKQLNKNFKRIPNDFKGIYLLFSNIIGLYNTENLYKLYVKYIKPLVKFNKQG